MEKERDGLGGRETWVGAGLAASRLLNDGQRVHLIAAPMPSDRRTASPSSRPPAPDHTAARERRLPLHPLQPFHPRRRTLAKVNSHCRPTPKSPLLHSVPNLGSARKSARQTTPPTRLAGKRPESVAIIRLIYRRNLQTNVARFETTARN